MLVLCQVYSIHTAFMSNKRAAKPTNREKIARKPVKLRANKVNRKTRITSSNNLKAIERRRKVIIMRRDGWDYEDIANAVEASVATVREDILYCLNLAADEMAETAEQTRELQKARLDALLKTNIRFALEPHTELRRDKLTGKEFVIEVPPDPAYANVVLKIEERRAKLLALDIPEVKKMEVTGIREYVGVDLEKI